MAGAQGPQPRALRALMETWCHDNPHMPARRTIGASHDEASPAIAAPSSLASSPQAPAAPSPRRLWCLLSHARSLCGEDAHGCCARAGPGSARRWQQAARAAARAVCSLGLHAPAQVPLHAGCAAIDALLCAPCACCERCLTRAPHAPQRHAGPSPLVASAACRRSVWSPSTTPATLPACAVSFPLPSYGGLPLSAGCWPSQSGG